MDYIFNIKLTWNKHAENVIYKAEKRLPILKRLARVKWGCNKESINTIHKMFIQPVLNYCNEVMISVSDNMIKYLEIFQNQVL